MKKFLFIAAYFPSHTPLIDNGTLKDSALKQIPYQNEKIYSFQHFGGHIIHFNMANYNNTYIDYNVNISLSSFIIPSNKYQILSESI